MAATDRQKVLILVLLLVNALVLINMWFSDPHAQADGECAVAAQEVCQLDSCHLLACVLSSNQAFGYACGEMTLEASCATGLGASSRSRRKRKRASSMPRASRRIESCVCAGTKLRLQHYRASVPACAFVVPECGEIIRLCLSLAIDRPRDTGLRSIWKCTTVVGD